jgi:hypothetical protein
MMRAFALISFVTLLSDAAQRGSGNSSSCPCNPERLPKNFGMVHSSWAIACALARLRGSAF